MVRTRSAQPAGMPHRLSRGSRAASSELPRRRVWRRPCVQSSRSSRDHPEFAQLAPSPRLQRPRPPSRSRTGVRRAGSGSRQRPRLSGVRDAARRLDGPDALRLAGVDLARRRGRRAGVAHQARAPRPRNGDRAGRCRRRSAGTLVVEVGTMRTRAFWWVLLLSGCTGGSAAAPAPPPPAPPAAAPRGYFACEAALREALRAEADADRARARELAAAAEQACAGVHEANAQAARQVRQALEGAPPHGGK